MASVVMPRRDWRSRRKLIVAVVFLRRNEDKNGRSLLEKTLQISTFGRFTLAAGGEGIAVDKWERKQALTLLKFLVNHLGRAVHREVLIDFLWPEVDENQGWNRLKVTMYFLRRQLRAAGIHEDVVETAGKAYLLRREAVWVDTEIFEKLVAEGGAHQRRQRWGEALNCYQEAQRLYRGDYLEEDIQADWCTAERGRLLEICIEMLAGLAECYAQQDCLTEAVQVCRDALIRDPYREGFHRALMQYLFLLGHTDSAVVQYHHCEHILARELDVEPMPETQRLYRWIVKQDSKPLTRDFPVAAPVSASLSGPSDTIAILAKGTE
jgi:DNA-binding SARP family transcriptional activator